MPAVTGLSIWNNKLNTVFVNSSATQIIVVTAGFAKVLVSSLIEFICNMYLSRYLNLIDIH